ncbi:MAG: hypothetical protein R3C62_00765 [Chloroflexota bacterium]
MVKQTAVFGQGSRGAWEQGGKRPFLSVSFHVHPCTLTILGENGRF